MTKRSTQHGSRQGRDGRWLASLAVAWMLAAGAWAQSPAPSPSGNTTAMPAATEKPSAAMSHAAPTQIVLPTLPSMPAAKGAVVDRVVAIVNGDLILDSDVDQEHRFAMLLPYGEASGAYSRDAAIERLTNRDLILQQSRLQPGSEISMEAATSDLDAIRKSLPTCKEFHCETKAGWDRFLATQGFTEQSLTELWRRRMEVLAFIEQRFRMGIKITQPEIETYYEKTLLPQYAARHATPPPVDAISSRIQEVLLQQRVSDLLGDWLKSLRAQGNVVVLHPGEEAP